jgi:hypothetical protein
MNLLYEVGRYPGYFRVIGRRQPKLLAEILYVVQRAPMKYIALFLGVTPESFSRLRNNITP